jgi:hypothetical protein
MDDVFGKLFIQNVITQLSGQQLGVFTDHCNIDEVRINEQLLSKLKRRSHGGDDPQKRIEV